MKKIGLLGLLSLALTVYSQSPIANCQAQVATPPIDPNNSPTNLISIPNTPLQMALNLLPAWDQTFTNAFDMGDLYIETSPLFKSILAAGSSPYLSLAAQYFPSLNFGLGAELVTLGDGAGNTAIDSTSVFGLARLPRGNIALYALAGVGEDWGLRKFMGEIGGGVSYQYHTAFGLFADTRYCITGMDPKENGWMSRIGVRINFGRKF